METFLHDISWVLALRSPALTQLFNALTLLGYTEFFLILLPIGFWLFDKAMFTRLAMLIGLVGLTNFFLKDLFHDPRPPIQFALDPRVGDSFGFPSGHAQIATAMWLWLAAEIRRTWFSIAAVLIVAGVAASRIYLGVHDVEDVLGGVLLGLASVTAFWGFMSADFKAWREAHPGVHLLGVAALAPLAYVAWPRAFPTFALGLVAFLFFWLLGAWLERSFVRYRRHPSWLSASLAAAVGVVVQFALLWALGKTLVTAGFDPEQARALQFAASALYITLLAPAVLRAVGAAGAETSGRS